MNKKGTLKELNVEKITSGVIFSSDFCEIKNWVYDFKEEDKPTQGYNDCLCLVYVKKGNFLFDLSNESYDMHSGHFIIDKPDYDYKLRPSAGESTIFNFTNDFYKQFVDDFNLKYSFFFSNKNILSLMLKAAPEAEYLHFQIMSKVGKAGKLELDQLVLELLKQIVATITNESFDYDTANSLKLHSLKTIEQAKEYMIGHFSTDISLFELADHCCISPFHFSRVFKKFTSFTPNQYLQNIRLKHGEMLLKNSSLSITEISYSSGFNSAEYFATAFKQKYKISPSEYRECYSSSLI